MAKVGLTPPRRKTWRRKILAKSKKDNKTSKLLQRKIAISSDNFLKQSCGGSDFCFALISNTGMPSGDPFDLTSKSKIFLSFGQPKLSGCRVFFFPFLGFPLAGWFSSTLSLGNTRYRPKGGVVSWQAHSQDLEMRSRQWDALTVSGSCAGGGKKREKKSPVYGKPSFLSSDRYISFSGKFHMFPRMVIAIWAQVACAKQQSSSIESFAATTISWLN